MLQLNIVSQKLKKEIQTIEIYKSLKMILCVVFICVCIYSISLLIGNLFLTIHFTNVISNATQLTKNSENYSKKIREINNQITNVEEIQKDTITWSYLLEFLLNKTNQNIKLNRISFDKTKNEILLSGNANTRDDLIEFKKIFDNEKFFSSDDLSINNLLEKNNVRFSFPVKIKSYEFEKL